MTHFVKTDQYSLPWVEYILEDYVMWKICKVIDMKIRRIS